MFCDITSLLKNIILYSLCKIILNFYSFCVNITKYFIGWKSLDIFPQADAHIP